MSGTYGQLLATEWRKVTTTKMLWALGLISIVFSVVNAAALVLVAGEPMPGSGLAFDGTLLLDSDYLTTIIASAGSSSALVLVLGIIAMTGEYRHMTITSTFLSTPRRGRVVAAKSALYAAFGAGIALASVAAVVATTVVLLIGRDHAPLTAETVGSVLVGAIVGMALYAVLGISLGALIRSQVAAIVVALVWVLLVESIVGLLLPDVARWLPGGALNAAMSVRLGETLEPTSLLPPWGAALVLLAYSAVFAVVGVRTTVSRDIT